MDREDSFDLVIPCRRSSILASWRRRRGGLRKASGWSPGFKFAVGANFDLNRPQFAQLVKIYGEDDEGWGVLVRTKKQPVFAAGRTLNPTHSPIILYDL